MYIHIIQNKFISPMEKNKKEEKDNWFSIIYNFLKKIRKHNKQK